MSNSLQPHKSQHARPPCPSPTPGVHSDSRPSSQWCHPAISSSVVPFSSCPQSLDLNQIPYDYTVEGRNRFKRLDLIDRVPDELWAEVRDIVQETRIKTIPKKRNAKKQNGCLRRPYNSWVKKRSEKQRRKGKIYPFECRVPRRARRDKKAFLMINAKK